MNFGQLLNEDFPSSQVWMLTHFTWIHSSLYNPIQNCPFLHFKLKDTVTDQILGHSVIIHPLTLHFSFIGQHDGMMA